MDAILYPRTAPAARPGLPVLRAASGPGAVRLALVPVGFLPVTLIAATCFGVAGLRPLAILLLAPALLGVAGLARAHADVAVVLRRGLVSGVVATALYDLFRWGFIWTGLIHGDPIPHIGRALGLHPDWLVGYAWRYLLNGTGLAVAFGALGLRGVRAGLAYGLFVAAGLLATLALSPYGETILFRLNLATVVMAVGGHLIYGAVLGAMAGTSPVRGLERAR